MKFDLKRPCSNCPFLNRDDAVRLRAGRIREIHDVVTASQGGSFPCHKTVSDDERDDDEGDGWIGPQPEWQWCAGALIYALKQERPNQIMRIALRLRLFNADELLATPEADEVFSSRAQWLREGVCK